MTQEQPLIIELPPFFLNQSRWKNFQDCDRYYGWLHIENLVPLRTSRNLAIGSAVHKAMVKIHEQSGSEESVEKATQDAEQYIEKALNTGPQLPGDRAEVEDAKKTVKNLIPAYIKHWSGMGQLWRPLGQELSFCVEVGEGTNVWLVGTIDNLVTYLKGLWLADYKTMGKLDMREFTKYEIDIQLTAYIYGGTKQLSLNAMKEGKPPVVIRGAIIDGLIKTSTPQFHREIYTRDINDLREFELEFCMKAWEIAAKHAMVRKDKTSYDLYSQKMYELGSTDWKVAFPKNTQQCFRYGTCSHRDLCIKDNDTRRLAYMQRTPDYVDNAAQNREIHGHEKP